MTSGIANNPWSQIGAPAIGVQELQGSHFPAVPERLTASQVSALQSNNTLVTGGAAGASTGWIASNSSAERFGVVSAGMVGTASVTIEGSLDGFNSAGTVGTISNDTNLVQFYTPPIKVPYPFLRITVAADGGGTHTIGRGL